MRTIIKWCSVDGCSNAHRAKGLCSAHYQRVRQRGTLETTGIKWCSVNGCSNPHRAKGLCNAHYQRVRQRGTLDETTTHQMVCTVDGCSNVHHAKGLCLVHYLRVRERGTLETTLMRGATCLERIDAKVSIEPNGCWVFTGALTTDGYGYISDGRRMRLVHIMTYEAKYGPVPAGLELDHFYCQRRACCNPDHVEPVTHAENIRRAVDMRCKC